MIAIVNISNELKPFGPHEYELRINQDVIATFTHNREESLSKCLMEASKSAEKAKWMKAYEMLKEFEK